MTAYLIGILIVIVFALGVAVLAVYDGHNALAKRLDVLEREQALQANHLRIHAAKLATLPGRPVILRGPKLGGKK